MANETVKTPFPSPEATDEGKKMLTPKTPKEWSDFINRNRENIIGGHDGESQVEIVKRIQDQAYLDAQQLQDSPPPLEKKDV